MDQRETEMVTASCLAVYVCPSKRVKRLRRRKFVPPAKSVTLSNWNVAATQKKESCITTVTTAQSAKLSESQSWTMIVMIKMI